MQAHATGRQSGEEGVITTDEHAAGIVRSENKGGLLQTGRHTQLGKSKRSTRADNRRRAGTRSWGSKNGEQGALNEEVQTRSLGDGRVENMGRRHT